MSQEITIIEDQIVPVVQEATSLKITSSEDMEMAVGLLTQLNTWADKLEEDRLSITAPINASLKEINNRYRKPKDLLMVSIEKLRSAMGTYQALALKTQQKAVLKLTKAMEKGTVSLESAVSKIEALSVEKKVDNVTFVPIEKILIVDIKKIPMQYHLPNEPMIREALKRGIRIPGVKYYIEQSVRNRRA